MLRLISIIALSLVSVPSYAGAFSNWAVPTRIDLERGNGVLVYGEFGNAGDCVITNKVYIPESHPQYDKAYAMVLAAFTAGKEVVFYIDQCLPVGWYAQASNTFNATTKTVYIRQPQ